MTVRWMGPGKGWIDPVRREDGPYIALVGDQFWAGLMYQTRKRRPAHRSWAPWFVSSFHMRKMMRRMGKAAAESLGMTYEEWSKMTDDMEIYRDRPPMRIDNSFVGRFR